MTIMLENLNEYSYPAITEYYQNQNHELLQSAYEDLFKDENGQARFFWNFLKEVGLKVHPGFYIEFNPYDGFQLLDQYGRLTYFSLNIAKKLRFTLDHVVQTPFDQLFERDPFITKQIMDVFLKMISGNKAEVYDISIIPKHTVKQVGFPEHDYSVEFKKAYPVHTKDGSFYGYVLRLDVQDVVQAH